MSTKLVLTPSPDHPIHIERAAHRVRVAAAGRTIGDSHSALILREATYPPVYYLPREDVDMAQMQRTSHHTYCPYKGDCAYYSIAAGGERAVNGAWSYEHPHPAVAQIRGHLAFYPDRVDSIEPVSD